MAVIIKPQPWTRQPQIPVGINPSWRGLASTGLIATQGVATDGSSITTVGTVPYTVTSGGMAFAHSSAGTNIKRATISGPVIPSGNGAAILVVFSAPSIGTNVAIAAFGSESGSAGNTVFGIFSGSTDAAYGRVVVGGDAGNEVSETSAAIGLNDGRVHCAVLSVNTFSATTDYSFYFDGRFSQTWTTGFTLGTGSIYSSICSGGLRRGAVDSSGGTCNVLMVVPFNRRLSAAQGIELSRNPWQLFAPLPRRILVSAPAGGATTYTKTATLDAAIQESKTATATLDAAIQQNNTKTATLDAAIAVTTTKTATLDAAIQQAITATATLDAAIQETLSKTATLDAVVQVAGVNTYTVTATLDAAIREAKTLTATLDAAIQQSNTKSATLDALIILANSKTATLDATILAAVTTYALLDAYIFDADAPVVETTAATGGASKRHKRSEVRRRYVMPDDTIIMATPTEAEQLVKLFVKPKPVKTIKQAPKRLIKELKAVDLVDMEPVYSDTVPTAKITVKKKAVWDVEADLYVKAMRMMAERELKRRRHEEELILLAA